MSVEIEVLEIENGSEYNDVVYDQYILAHLPNDKSIWLFDDELLLDDNSIRNRKRVEIEPVFNFSEVRVIYSINHGIEPVDEQKKSDHIYCGKISKKFENTKTDSESGDIFQLDVGIGTVKLFMGSDYDNSLNVGDEIRISAFRSDLNSIVED